MKSPGALFRGVAAVSLLALMALSYVDMIYLPQKKALDEQHASIAALSREVVALRTDQREQEALRKRVQSLEAALYKLSPKTATGIGVRAPGAPAPPPAPAAPAPPAAPPPVAAGGPNASRADAGKESKAGKASQHGEAAPALKWRSDDKCGAAALLNGKPAECNPEGSFPCCAPSGWCGDSAAHCACEGCIDYRALIRQDAATVEMAAYREDSNKTIAVVIPFRDRGVHLERFRERMQSHAEAWNARGIGHTWVVIVVEQFDNQLFNRGWLFNVGFHFAQQYAKKTGVAFDCVVMQDIDLLPEPSVDYGWCIWPIQLSGEIECWSWSVPYPDNVGGVASLSPKHWTAINGFSNEYEGWGGEDDDFYLRLKQNSLLKGKCHTWCKEAKPPKVPMVYRPPLGRGRFGCLHDGDHTPRERAPKDAPMWSRLNAMKANSKRWRTDGLSSLQFNAAGPAVWSKACGRCRAEEDPVLRRRLFSEMWVRVSMKPVSRPERVTVKLLVAGAKCSQTSRALTVMPAGLESLRASLSDTFRASCGNDTSWAQRTSFLLADVTLGQALVVGEGMELVVPDSSLPSLPSPGVRPESPPAGASDYLLQGQRLSRWLRKLPVGHRAWLLAEGRTATELRRGFVDAGRRVPQTAPVCISQTAFEGSKKYRATPGTRWCGDGGWSNDDYFLALRSKTSVPKDKLVPICISYNPNYYTYRFENSEAGCVGSHSSGTTWKHAHTIHTSKDATGEQLCVGFVLAKDKTRWVMQKKPRCDSGGFTHSFSFSAMTDNFRPPLAPCCFLEARAESDQATVLRLAAPEQCTKPPAGEKGFSAWRVGGELTLLQRRHSKDDVRLCPAEGLAEKEPAGASKTQSRLWRVFRGEACAKAKFVTHESDGHKVHWEVQQEPQLYVPTHGKGTQFSLCRAKRKKAPGFLYTWTTGECQGEGAHKELSFHDISAVESLKYLHLVDDVT